MESLDPRINRVDLPTNHDKPALHNPQYGDSFEVFVQKKQGGQHTHEGSLHATDPDIALVFAKEQFGRRGRCYNIWVVPSRFVFALPVDNADMFSTNSGKKYRNSNGFKVSDKIKAYKKLQKNKE